MSYSKFAYLYDDLMKDAPYSDWIRITKELIKKYDINPNSIVDLGCGTGNITLLLSKEGYNLIGIDLSSDMLAVAYEKIHSQKLSVSLLEQNMKEFELAHTVDLVISFCDSMNYLNGFEEVRETFKRVYTNLNYGGYFIFDMHSPYKITDVFKDQTFAWNDEAISVIWQTEVDNSSLMVEHDLSFFVELEDGLYERINETHKQQTYTSDTISELLSETGFELLELFADFNINHLDNQSERIFYVAKKNS